jgi:hypothetical protein
MCYNARTRNLYYMLRSYVTLYDFKFFDALLHILYIILGKVYHVYVPFLRKQL